MSLQRYYLHENAPEKLEFEILPMKEYLSDYVDASTAPHIHSFYQIIWFYQGRGEHHVDFKQYPIQPNTIELLLRDEDVQVLHGFDSIENAHAYLEASLFTQDVVRELGPLLNSDPEVRVYSCN